MQAEDYFAVQNQLNRYFQYVDAGDFERCANLFAHADLIYTQSGQTFSKDPAGIAKQMRSFVRLFGDKKTPRTRHHSGNIIIEFEGEIARTTCSAVITTCSSEGTRLPPFSTILVAVTSQCVPFQ